MPKWRHKWLIFRHTVTCPNCGATFQQRKWNGAPYTLHCGRCGRIEALDARKRVVVFCAGEEQYDYGHSGETRGGKRAAHVS